MAYNDSKLMPALWGGILIGVIDGFPGLDLINCFCCAGVIGGGILAVYLYRRQIGEQVIISNSDGIILGVLAGLIGAFIGSLLGSLFGVAMLDMLEQVKPYIDDPEVIEFLRHFQNNEQTWTWMFFALSFGLSVIINSIFGLIGGLIGVSLWGTPKEIPDATVEE
ncbi:hypothetical protein GF407_02315 [candidate division KSB1 bacterium]|nr:hypothetical protein [candidate division KSB1 bacterium]